MPAEVFGLLRPHVTVATASNCMELHQGPSDHAHLWMEADAQARHSKPPGPPPRTGAFPAAWLSELVGTFLRGGLCGREGHPLPKSLLQLGWLWQWLLIPFFEMRSTDHTAHPFEVYNWVVLVYSQSCATVATVSLAEHFQHSIKKPCSCPPLPSPQMRQPLSFHLCRFSSSDLHTPGATQCVGSLHLAPCSGSTILCSTCQYSHPLGARNRTLPRATPQPPHTLCHGGPALCVPLSVGRHLLRLFPLLRRCVCCCCYGQCARADTRLPARCASELGVAESRGHRGAPAL